MLHLFSLHPIFLYQFNITLEQILLSAEGSEIRVEGIIEDIDVVTPTETKAIQCKYHETIDIVFLGIPTSDLNPPFITGPAEGCS